VSEYTGFIWLVPDGRQFQPGDSAKTQEQPPQDIRCSQSLPLFGHPYRINGVGMDLLQINEQIAGNGFPAAIQ